MPDQTTPVEQFLRLLAEQSKEHGFILLNPDARVTWWSPGAAHFFDRESDEMVGHSLAVLFTFEDWRKEFPTKKSQWRARSARRKTTDGISDPTVFDFG